MDALDVRKLLERDWQRVANAKADHWKERKRRLGAIEGLRAADKLRRQAVAARPGWPDEAERAADLEAHVQLSTRLKRASAARRD